MLISHGLNPTAAIEIFVHRDSRSDIGLGDGKYHEHARMYIQNIILDTKFMREGSENDRI